ncbi:MAG: hypothetical protein M3065_18250, partial [Actinomycetota bacterium]|nr:hypothetical protein [Actinomycetota bacterium]
ASGPPTTPTGRLSPYRGLAARIRYLPDRRSLVSLVAILVLALVLAAVWRLVRFTARLTCESPNCDAVLAVDVCPPGGWR